MATIPTKEFKMKSHAIMWIEDFQFKQPHIELTIIRNVDKVAHYVVGELFGMNDELFVFQDDKKYPRDKWIKSFI